MTTWGRKRSRAKSAGEGRTPPWGRGCQGATAGGRTRGLIGLLIGGLMVWGAAPDPAAAQGLSVGVETGLAVADIRFDPDEDARVLRRALAGGVVRYEFGASGTFGLQSGLSHVRKGSRLAPTTVEWKFDYLQLPVLATVRVPLLRVLQPRVYGGVAPALETRCETLLNGLAGASCGDWTDALDAGLLLGAGLGVSLGPGTVTGDVRYDHGLTDVNALEGSDQTMKHRAWYFTAGFLHPL